MSEERHEYWAPREDPDDHVFGSDEMRSKFYVMGGLNVACLIALLIGVGVLTNRGFTPPPFIGQSHGLFFVGEGAPISTIDWDADMQQQFNDTIEVLFLRTEKGALPDLANFVEASVLDQIEDGYTSGQVSTGPGFAQTFTLLESRNAPSPGRPVLRRHMTGILSSRSIDGSQNSTIYLQCDFAPREASADNPTGWKLSAITRLREDEFFSEERERERIKRLGLDSETAKTPSKK